MLNLFLDELDQLSNQGNESHFVSFVLLSLSYVSIIYYRQDLSIVFSDILKIFAKFFRKDIFTFFCDLLLTGVLTSGKMPVVCPKKGLVVET